MYPASAAILLPTAPKRFAIQVREQIKYGVDVISCTHGGVLSLGDKPGAEQLTYEEMKMAVDEAHRTGRRWPRTATGRRESRTRFALALTPSSTAASSTRKASK